MENFHQKLLSFSKIHIFYVAARFLLKECACEESSVASIALIFFIDVVMLQGFHAAYSVPLSFHFRFQMWRYAFGIE